MAIVIEDGSVVVGAQSYATVAELDAFAAERAITVSAATEAAKEALLIKAMDWIEGHRNDFVGNKYVSTQPLQWPRSHVYIDGYYVELNTIPDDLKLAQIQMAIEADSAPIYTTSTGKEVIRKKVGPLETEYAQAGSISNQKIYTLASTLIAPLLKSGNGLSPFMRV